MALPAQQTETPLPVRWLDEEEEREFFDRSVRELLGISGDEFTRRWNAGDYDEIADDPTHWDVLYLAMLGNVGR
ncbi:MAG: hypothetical protein ACRDJW_09200 [Thermomicrobiales bacterium]